MAEPESGVMFCECIIALNGIINKDMQKLFETATDALSDDDPLERLIVLATLKTLADQRFDLLSGEIQEGAFCTKEDGWKFIARDTNGFSCWIHPEWDELWLTRNFYKE